jgi:hypothetical protein
MCQDRDALLPAGAQPGETIGEKAHREWQRYTRSADGESQTGAAMGVTYWDTAKALAASEQTGIQSRTQAAKSVPGTQVVNVERGELMTMDRADAPKAGSSIRLVTYAALTFLPVSRFTH